MKIYFKVFYICLISCAVEANDVFRVEHVINSQYPQEERVFTVQLPKSYHTQSTRNYPVLYILDGESNLEYSAAVASFLAGNALMPELIIVAMHSGITRTRDYLPKNTQVEDAPSGDAAQFLQHLEQELIPFIEQQYHAASFRLLSGHSYGGVFVTHVLLERPGLFRGYLAQSPYMDQAIGAPIVERVPDFLDNNPKLHTFYYLNYGDEPNLEQNIQQIQKLFESKAPESFHWHAEHNAGKSHMSTRLVGLYDGLEQMFAADWPLSQQAIFTGKAAGVKAHIEGLSKKYGYPVLYNEQLFAQAVQILRSQQDLAGSSEIADLFVAQYPKSTTAQFFLTIALMSNGNQEAASKALESAISLYLADPRPELKPLYLNMQQLSRQLTKS